ncbi:MAG: TIGR04222 domain-containing membrane protein, partial [Gordonia sp. (in: high G+C Gram-positive bacteria)]
VRAEPLQRLGADLIGRGLIGRRRRAPGVGFLIGVLALGIVRAVAGASNGHPVGFLVVMVIVVAVITMIYGFSGTHLTAHGQAVLAALRHRHRMLAPSLNPSVTTYGIGPAAFATALFGLGALTLIEPAFRTSEMVTAMAGTQRTAFGSTMALGSSCGSAGSGCSGGGGCGGGGGGGGGGGCGG